MDEGESNEVRFRRVCCTYLGCLKERRTLLHGDKGHSMAMNVSWSSVLLQDFHNANTAISDIFVGKRRVRVHHWLPPAVDACVNKELNRFSVGVY